MPRVAYVNNYATRRARRGCEEESYPDHHLYGTRSLPPGLTVQDWTLPAPTARVASSLGPLGAQLAVLRSGADVVYSANLAASLGLGLAAAVPGTGRPFVSVCHHTGGSPRYRRALRRVLRTSSATVVLSNRRAEELRSVAPDADVRVLGWGPDLAFPPFVRIAARAARPGALVSLGKTYRDTTTLTGALALLHQQGRPARASVFGAADEALPPGAEQLQVAAPDSRGPSTYLHVVPHLERAQAVAICLDRTEAYTGLTELMDAMACGLPVVHTASPYLDVDVEAIGCGLRVAGRDVAGWADALGAVMSDPDLAHEMGQRGRRWLEQHCNSRLFSAEIGNLLLRATA